MKRLSFVHPLSAQLLPEGSASPQVLVPGHQGPTGQPQCSTAVPDRLRLLRKTKENICQKITEVKCIDNVRTAHRGFSSCRSHRIIERFGLEGTFRGNLAQPSAVSRDISNQTRLLRVMSHLALNVSRDGASTISLGNPFQYFTTLTVKNFFFISSLNPPSLSLKPLFPVLSKGKTPAQKGTKSYRRKHTGGRLVLARDGQDWSGPAVTATHAQGARGQQ